MTYLFCSPVLRVLAPRRPDKNAVRYTRPTCIQYVVIFIPYNMCIYVQEIGIRDVMNTPHTCITTIAIVRTDAVYNRFCVQYVRLNCHYLFGRPTTYEIIITIIIVFLSSRPTRSLNVKTTPLLTALLILVSTI